MNGDFHIIRSVEERMNKVQGVCYEGFTHFNWFIEDGLSMSQLNRFMLSEYQSSLWPDCIKTAIARSLLDHCLVMLAIDEYNWGPRSQLMLKCWEDIPRYQDFVQEQWLSFQVEGWVVYIFKEKLKLVKRSLKTWHENHTPNLEGRLKAVKDRMSLFMLKGRIRIGGG